VVNPVVAFVESLALDDLPMLYTMPTTVAPDDFMPPAAAPGPARPASGVRNVVVFVLESVPAALVGLYGSPFPTTPELDARRDQALVFRNAYAHWPTTNATLVSLLTSSYPWVASKTITSQYPDIPLAALSSELKERGYRTAFFNSADLRFQNAEGFLRHRDLDVVEDYRTIPCDVPVKQHAARETFSSIAWVNLDGLDDVCTADAFVDWIARDRERPLFGVVWTTMTHYPYFAPQDEVEFATDDDELYRYLNALRHGDRALGRVLEGLERLEIADETLVVVLGDHGEAHGQHGERGHGSQLYEENIHIPLVLINPRLFRGGTSDAIGGLVDVAPTIMDILGLPPAATWQGRSLLAEDRPPRTYFFSPLAELLFGYREGDVKYIYNASRGSLEVYDLARDPTEQHNAYNGDPELREAVLDRLAAWVQYQDRFIRSLAEPRVSAD
jgi:lipoteichoic acid synthase